MVIYSVNISVKVEAETEWLDWMTNIHIQNVLKTGYFNNHRIFKVLIPSNVRDEVTYVVQYECESFEKYKEYSEMQSPRLQKEHAAKFVGKIRTARSIMEEI